MQWTNEEVLRLIEEFRERRALWAGGGPDETRAHAFKAEAWLSLARACGRDVVDLRKKLNSLFASHRRERLRVRAGGRSKWFAYPHLSFLRARLDAASATNQRPEVQEHYVKDGTPDGTPDEERSEEEEERLEEDEESPLHLDYEVVVKHEPMDSPEPPEPPESPEPPHAPAPSPRRQTARPRQLRAARALVAAKPTAAFDRHLVRAVRSTSRGGCRCGCECGRVRGRDECEVFGEYIANALRKHDERTRAMIKHAIGNILFEQEMRQYAGAPRTAPATDTAPDDARNPLLLDVDRSP